MELVFLIVGFTIAGMLWHIGEQLKGRNVIDAARLKLQMKESGMTEPAIDEFMRPFVKALKRT